MRFKLDENLPGQIGTLLREHGSEADTVKDEALRGYPDPVILERARRDARILLTEDKGMGNILEYPPSNYGGIVLFRPHNSGRKSLLAFASRFLPDLLKMELERRLTVITDGGIRQYE